MTTPTMPCAICGEQIPESLLDLSHDVPCYVFEGKNRKERKQEADKWGRHYLCEKHHHIYENTVFAIMAQSLPKEMRVIMRNAAKAFSEPYFKNRKKENDSNTKSA
jgi:hypothetical protein